MVFVVFNILFALNLQAYLVKGSERVFTCGSKTAQTACLPPHYNKFSLPNADGVNPINIELLIEDILEIKEKDQPPNVSVFARRRRSGHRAVWGHFMCDFQTHLKRTRRVSLNAGDRY